MAESQDDYVEAEQLTPKSGGDDVEVFVIDPLDNAVDHDTTNQRADHGAIDLADGIIDAVEDGDPSVTSLTPATAPASATPITVTVTGTNFQDGAVVEVDQTEQATTFVSDTSLTVSWAPATAGTSTFTVRNPNERESNDISFTVTAAVADEDEPAPQQTKAKPMKAAKSTRRRSE